MHTAEGHPPIAERPTKSRVDSKVRLRVHPTPNATITKTHHQETSAEYSASPVAEAPLSLQTPAMIHAFRSHSLEVAVAEAIAMLPSTTALHVGWPGRG